MQTPVCDLEGKFVQKSGLSCEEENKAKPNISNKSNPNNDTIEKKTAKKRTE